MTPVTRRILAGALLLGGSGALQAAPIYNYQADEPRQNPNGGTLTSIDTTYDENTETFSWSYTVEDPSADRAHNGFWLVVNNGPSNPKGSDRFLAILYGDLVNNDLTAYVYNGNNSPRSYDTRTDYIQTFDNELFVSDYSAAGTRDVSFSIDVRDLNATTPDPVGARAWEGIRFDDQLGIWFHPTAGTGAVASYETVGDRTFITSFASRDENQAGWYDTGALETTRVPEPSSLALAGAGLLAFGAVRRRSRKQA